LASFSVMVVDDGELADVRETLVDLSVEFVHLRGGAVPPRLEPPSRLFVTTARRASLVRGWLGERPTCVAVVEEDSVSLRGMLRALGFGYLVRRPIHPTALRLMLLYALYRGEERRASRRVPIGEEVTVRHGLHTQTGLLADLSPHGCRLMCEHPLKEGSRATVQLPPGLIGSTSLSLSAHVLWVDEQEGIDGPTRFTAALRFGKMKAEVRECIQNLVAAVNLIPEGENSTRRLPSTVVVPELPRLPRSGASTAFPASPRSVAITAEPLDLEEAKDRRVQPRSHYDQRVLASLEDQMHRALLGRDLSAGGMRIEPHPELETGAGLRLAIYDPDQEAPIVVQAVVQRDCGRGGMAIVFENVDRTTARRLEALVAALPPVERLDDGEAGALGTVISQIVS